LKIDDNRARAGAHLVQDEKVDWFSLIIELERSGCPHNAIATYVGVSRRTVGSWKQGASGVHTLGPSRFYTRYKLDELDLLSMTIEKLTEKHYVG
jgi:hypothetical protein